MSVLGSITNDDIQGGRGAPLPNTKWSGVVEEASIQQEGNSTRLFVRLGQLTTPDGSSEYVNGGSSPYRIGNRKVFVREWTDHPSTMAAQIGQRRIKQMVVAAGLVPAPKKGESVEDPFQTFEEVASALVGKRILFTSKQVTRKTKDAQGNLVTKFEDDGITPVVDVEVAVFHAP